MAVVKGQAQTPAQLTELYKTGRENLQTQIDSDELAGKEFLQTLPIVNIAASEIKKTAANQQVQHGVNVPKKVELGAIQALYSQTGFEKTAAANLLQEADGTVMQASKNAVTKHWETELGGELSASAKDWMGAAIDAGAKAGLLGMADLKQADFSQVIQKLEQVSDIPRPVIAALHA